MLSVEKRDFRRYIWLKRASQERKYRNQPRNWFRIGCYIVSSVGKVLVNIDKSFLFRLIQTEKFDDIANQSSGSKMPRADWNLLSNTEFMVPAEIEEERKIGQYFSELDHLITLHQSKAEKLQKIKKSLLERMFA